MSKIKEWNLLATPTFDNEAISTSAKKINLDLKDMVYIQSEKEINASPKRFVDPTDYALTCGCETAGFYYGSKGTSCKIATRTPNKTVNGSYKAYDPVTGYFSVSACSQNQGIQPVISLNIDSNTLQYFRENINHDITNGAARHRIYFGKYPQSKVDSNLDKKLEYLCRNKLLNSVESYNGFYSEENKFIINTAYIYNGEIYLRAKPNFNMLTKMIKYNNGSVVNQQSNSESYVWHKIEPIEWEIINWDNLPATINPTGNGTDNEIKLLSTKAILSGIPFFPNYESAINTTNTSYYQNSLIRAFLNGYNIHNEIQNNNNGAIEAISNKNFNQMYSDFISTAFKEYIELEKSNMTDIASHIRTKKNKIKITETPMSIDEQIKFYINNGLPFMLHGKSGIGKSRRIADIDPDYFLLTLRNGMMPEEILGKECPNPNGDGTKWYAPSWFNELCEKCKNEPDKNHILFIDELTNVNEYEQSLVYHIVLNHSLGVTSGKLPENCVVVAAGNSKDESNSAYNMSEPLFRRFHGHIYLPLDLEALLEWGSEPRKDNPERTNLHPLVARFISTYPKTIYTEYDPEKEGKNFAIDPRAWEQVSDIIYHNDNTISKELLNNKIGEPNTTMFVEFAEQDLITIDEIMDDSFDHNSIPRKLDEQYALALSLRTANEQEIKKVREFIADHLSGETLAKFDYIWVGKDPERAMIIEDLKETYNKSRKDNPGLTKTEGTPKRKPRAIPFSQFLGSDADWCNPSRENKMSINCNSREKAEFLCKALANANKRWTFDGKKCNDQDIHYAGYTTCYTNTGDVATYNNMITDDVVVYDMRHIDFSEYLSDDDLDKLDDIIEQEGYKRVKIKDFVRDHKTWKDINRPDYAYIHCKNEEYADILCRAFTRLGLTWSSGDHYIQTKYTKHQDKSCYSNTGHQGDYTRIYNNRNCPIYDFAEVDFSEVYTPDEIMEIEKLIKKNGDYDKYKTTYTLADLEEFFSGR